MKKKNGCSDDLAGGSSMHAAWFYSTIINLFHIKDERFEVYEVTHSGNT